MFLETSAAHHSEKEIVLFIPPIVRLDYCGSYSLLILFHGPFALVQVKSRIYHGERKRDFVTKMFYESKHFPGRIARLCSEWAMEHAILPRKTGWKVYALEQLLYKTAYRPLYGTTDFPN